MSIDGRHAFQILEHLGAEADRLGVRAVDMYGNPGSVAEFLDKIAHYITARENEADQLREALMGATLTDAEREAVETSFDAMQYAADELGLSQADCDRLVATLRGLLERQQSTQPTHTTPNECTVCPKRTSLTDAERDAISLMAEVAADPRGGAVLDGYKVAATLRGLLERLC